MLKTRCFTPRKLVVKGEGTVRLSPKGGNQINCPKAYPLTPPVTPIGTTAKSASIKASSDQLILKQILPGISKCSRQPFTIPPSIGN
jgi:hypothetical protein